MNPVTWLILAAYTSLLVELLVFPIPSEASTYQLFFESDSSGASGESNALHHAQQRSGLAKFFCYLLPTAVGVLLFLIPLAALRFPHIIDQLGPIQSLRTPSITWLGASLVLLGRMLTFGSVLQLRRQKQSRKLSARGIFTFSRNPGLVGMYLFYLGNAFLFPCIVLFVGFLPYVVNMHRRVLMEEQHLTDTLGADYRHYLNSVPRYLPVRIARK